MGALHESKVDKWLEEDNLMLITCWSRDGYTLTDIARKIGIDPATLSQWKKKYIDIKQAIETGKEVPDYKVENALYKTALGYKTNEVKITKERNGMGQIVITKIERVEKEVAPNVSAIGMWLTNRNPDKWKKNRDNIVDVDEENNNITVNIIRKGNPNKVATDSTKVEGTDEEEWDITTNDNNQKEEEKKQQKKSSSKEEYNEDDDWDAVIEEVEGW